MAIDKVCLFQTKLIDDTFDEIVGRDRWVVIVGGGG
jgi:hypothetical protein